MTGGEHRAVLAALLDRYGQTYAEQAGITLADRPSPLYQMLVAATLASAPVPAETAAAAARELWAAGLRNPRVMRDAGWQLARLAAALVRVARDATAARKVREAALAAR